MVREEDMRLFLVIGVVAAALAQISDSGFLRKGTFEDRSALVMANDKMALTVLTTGATLANLVLAEDPGKQSPFWNAPRMARELGQKTKGGGIGHFVCVDGFGPVSDEEKAAGMPGHGEAHTVPLELRASGKQGNVATMTLSGRLPLVQEVFTRTFRMVDGENVIYVDSELESELAFDRPVCWAEHATIGSPFLEPGVTVVDHSGHRGMTRPHPAVIGPVPRRLASAKEFTWPMGPGVNGGEVDLRFAPPHPNSLDHTTYVMTGAKVAFVTALNTSKRLLLGYLFKTGEYPWLQDWQNYPPNLKMSRGLEFSTQPFDVPRREVIQTNTMLGTSMYRWLPAKSKIQTHFLLFYTRTPEGMRKVDDVRLESGRIVIEDRANGKQVTLTASLPL